MPYGKNESAASANSAVNEKRTQLPDGTDVTSFIPKDYENNTHSEPNENKAFDTSTSLSAGMAQDNPIYAGKIPGAGLRAE